MGANKEDREKRRYFNIVSKKEKLDMVNRRIIFESVKGEDGKYNSEESFKSLSGYIVHAEIKDYEYPKGSGKKKPKFSIELQDPDGRYVIEFLPTNAGFGLINSLLSADFTREIKIEGWISKEDYANAGSRYVGDKEPIPWAIPYESQPKTIETTNAAGEKEKDSSLVVKFWVEQFSTIIKMAASSNYPQALKDLERAAVKHDDVDVPSRYNHKKSATVEQNWPTTPPPAGEEDDDLPF